MHYVLEIWSKENRGETPDRILVRHGLKAVAEEKLHYNDFTVVVVEYGPCACGHKSHKK